MFESHQITLQCPKCRCKSYHRRRWLQTNPTLTGARTVTGALLLSLSLPRIAPSQLRLVE